MLYILFLFVVINIMILNAPRCISQNTKDVYMYITFKYYNMFIQYNTTLRSYVIARQSFQISLYRNGMHFIRHNHAIALNKDSLDLNSLGIFKLLVHKSLNALNTHTVKYEIKFP